MSRQYLVALAIAAAIVSGAVSGPQVSTAAEVVEPMGAVTGCDTVEGNVLLNCGFEFGDPPGQWTLLVGQSFQRDTGLVYVGTASARVTVVDTGNFEYMDLESACTPVASGVRYAAGAHFRAAAGDGVRCNVELFTWSDFLCTTNVDIFDSGPVISSTSGWIRIELHSAALSEQYATLQLKCGWFTGGSSTFDMRADEAFLAPLADPVFGDGFETVSP